MRKKQLYAILLAGAVAATSVPSAAFAAEQQTAETSAELTEAVSEEAGAEEEAVPEQPTETPAEPTETPAEPETPAPEQPTEAPAEPTETPAESVGDQQETPGTTETPEPSITPTVTVTPEPSEEGPVEGEDTGVYISFTAEDGTEIKKEYYRTLQYAVNAALKYYQADDHDKQKAVVVKIEKQFFLSDTVRIENGKIHIIATKPEVSIGRIDPSDSSRVFTGDMFAVTGKGSELQLSTEGEGSRFVISGDNGSDGAEASDGALIKVENEAAFGMSEGVILTANNTTADGAAIDNKNGGSVVIKGGSVTGNTGAKGAVYTNKDIAVQGTVSIKDNTGANLYLDGDAAAVVTDVLNNSSISVTSAKAADKKVIAKAGTKTDGTNVSAEEFKTVPAQFAYDTKEYTVTAGTDGLTAVLKKEATATVTPSPKPTQTPSFLTYQSKSLKWVDHTTATAVMNTTKDCKWYYYFVKEGTSTEKIKKLYSSKKATNEAKANTKFTVKAEKVPEENSWLVVAAKPTSGSAQLRVLKLNAKTRPTPSVTTRAPRKYQVEESKIIGLENPIKLFPNKFYDFQVLGAGQNDKNPISGDERWIPKYWSMSVNGSRHKSWQIGIQAPKKDDPNVQQKLEKLKRYKVSIGFTLYVFFEKEIYNGKIWNKTDVIEYMKTSFSSDNISDKEWNDYIKEWNETHPDDRLDYDGTSAGSVADLTPTEAASEQDTGSSEKTAADTADRTPIGSMSTLAMLSLLAGGYVIVRKRKKEEI